MTKDYMIVVLPVEGSPYVNKEIYKEKDMLKPLQEVVGGKVEIIYNDSELSSAKMLIHPLFAMENARWKIAYRVIMDKKSKIFINENGMNECSPNMATIMLRKEFDEPVSREEYAKAKWKPTRVPFFGNIAVKILKKELEKYVKVEDFYDIEESESESDDESVGRLD